MRTKVAGRVKALSTVTEENILCISDSINCANTALLEEKQTVFSLCIYVGGDHNCDMYSCTTRFDIGGS